MQPKGADGNANSEDPDQSRSSSDLGLYYLSSAFCPINYRKKHELSGPFPQLFPIQMLGFN